MTEGIKLHAGLIHKLIVVELSDNVSYPLIVPDKLRPHLTSFVNKPYSDESQGAVFPSSAFISTIIYFYDHVS